MQIHRHNKLLDDFSSDKTYCAVSVTRRGGSVILELTLNNKIELEILKILKTGP